MELPLFHLMDETIALLEQRRSFYLESSYELQALFNSVLKGEGLLGINARVKGAQSLKEKLLRKRLYLRYTTAHELLSNLSDLVGMRVECRFLTEEATIYEKLLSAFTLRHEDGSRSMEAYPNIRLLLDSPQPETMKNGLSIYRIDGRYHKNGIVIPFEMQIKALVHVFWSEIEHQLIYKNNNYQLMDGFMKKLLFSTYETLEQVDRHLKLIYDQIQRPNEPKSHLLVQRESIETVVAKIISDLFYRRMESQLGFSLKLRNGCDILARYLLTRYKGPTPNDTFTSLFRRIRAAADSELDFQTPLALGAPFESEDPFIDTLGNYLVKQLNRDYDWNLFFRMLFALEPGNNLQDLQQFLGLYRQRFAADSLYRPLTELWGEEKTNAYRQWLLSRLAVLLCEHGEITMLDEDTTCAVENAIEAACKARADGNEEAPLLEEALLREALSL